MSYFHKKMHFIKGIFYFLESKNASALGITKISKIAFSKYVLGLLSLAEFGWTNSKLKNQRLLVQTSINPYRRALTLTYIRRVPVDSCFPP